MEKKKHTIRMGPELSCNDAISLRDMIHGFYGVVQHGHVFD